MTDVVLPILSAIAGVVLLYVVIADALATTVGVGPNNGPLTSRILWAYWKTSRRPNSRGPRSFTGPAALGCTVALWWLLTVVGWWLIFSADPSSIVDSETDMPADAWSRVFFVISTIFTLGEGNYSPSSPSWHLVAALTVTQGFLIFTLIVSDVIGLSRAVVDKRHLARSILVLGERPEDILVRSWDGRGFSSLEPWLVPLTIAITGVTELHYGHSLLVCFGSTNRHSADLPALATLHEAIVLLLHTIDEVALPDRLMLEAAATAIDDHVNLLWPHDRDEILKADVPPLAGLAALDEAGIPLHEQTVSTPWQSPQRPTRARLFVALEQKGWSWEAALGHESADQ